MRLIERLPDLPWPDAGGVAAGPTSWPPDASRLRLLHDDALPLTDAEDRLAAVRRRWWRGGEGGDVAEEVSLLQVLRPRGSRDALLLAELGRQMLRVPDGSPRRLAVGEAALGWSWAGGTALDVAGFVRGQVVVVWRRLGSAAAEAEAVLREIDAELVAATGRPPGRPTLLDGLREQPRLVPGARIELGPAPPELITRSSHGAVNRDPDDPGHAYYRAPSEPCDATIDLALPEPGLLVAHDGVAVTITREAR